jgi:exoribonuclease R
MTGPRTKGKPNNKKGPGNKQVDSKQYDIHTSGVNEKSLARRLNFDLYLSEVDVANGLASGELLQGYVRINKKKRHIAYVTIEGLSKDVVVLGAKDQNRAFDGDLVVLKVCGELTPDEFADIRHGRKYFREQLKSPVSDILTELQKDEDEDQLLDNSPHKIGFVVAIKQRRPGLTFSGFLLPPDYMPGKKDVKETEVDAVSSQIEVLHLKELPANAAPTALSSAVSTDKIAKKKKKNKKNNKNSSQDAVVDSGKMSEVSKFSHHAADNTSKEMKQTLNVEDNAAASQSIKVAVQAENSASASSLHKPVIPTQKKRKPKKKPPTAGDGNINENVDDKASLNELSKQKGTSSSNHLKKSNNAAKGTSANSSKMAGKMPFVSTGSSSLNTEGSDKLLVSESNIKEKNSKPKNAGKPPLKGPGSSASLQRNSKLLHSSSKNGGQTSAEKQSKQGMDVLKVPLRVYFQPSDKRAPLILVPFKHTPKDYISNYEKYKDKLYLVQIVKWPAEHKNPSGKVLKELGDVGDILVETTAIIETNHVPDYPFSEKVDECLKEFIPFEIPESEIAKRRDLRRERIFTIDPETARDLDDAISIKKLPDGVFEVGVHIADVSYFVQQGNALDEEAKKRATTTYLVQRAVPMLPRLLCENLCSLNPGMFQNILPFYRC